ncbi:MAG: chromosome partitioning protein ParA [Fulvimarina manganoxydans]|uniref:chromosome partitioning protein ParA n=1 Tax=Fulvimarina manganoxydans TaxID=937218 RepID=UPI002356F920|nr:chromosome partitioning protein ParA [Fulvimarina manganoxydans]MCK5934568.1 chromosome partitioning protein ParA [Fulvimarina manganoxydans]
MIGSIAIGTLKSSGSTTLALMIASVVARCERPVTLLDAAPDPDLHLWVRKGFGISDLKVKRVERVKELADMVEDARRRERCVVVDAGREAPMIAQAASICDRFAVPVRLSPASAIAAIGTDRLLDGLKGRARDRGRRLFVANAVTLIPSRVARAVEAIVASSATPRLPIGLSLRAAYEAPFLGGGTLFDLMDEEAPGLARAQSEAFELTAALGLVSPVRPASLAASDRPSRSETRPARPSAARSTPAFAR